MIILSILPGDFAIHATRNTKHLQSLSIRNSPASRACTAKEVYYTIRPTFHETLLVCAYLKRMRWRKMPGSWGFFADAFNTRKPMFTFASATCRVTHEWPGVHHRTCKPGEPGGFIDGSRWLSEAIPPDSGRFFPLASRRDARARAAQSYRRMFERVRSGTPPGSTRILRIVSGGIAALNHAKSDGWNSRTGYRLVNPPGS